MKPAFIAAVVFVAALAVACGTSKNPSNDTASQYGAITGGWKCTCPGSAATCKLECPDGTVGECQSGQPFCDVSAANGGYACACPNGATSCAITARTGPRPSAPTASPTASRRARATAVRSAGISTRVRSRMVGAVKPATIHKWAAPARPPAARAATRW